MCFFLPKAKVLLVTLGVMIMSAECDTLPHREQVSPTKGEWIYDHTHVPGKISMCRPARTCTVADTCAYNQINMLNPANAVGHSRSSLRICIRACGILSSGYRTCLVILKCRVLVKRLFTPVHGQTLLHTHTPTHSTATHTTRRSGTSILWGFTSHGRSVFFYAQRKPSRNRE